MYFWNTTALVKDLREKRVTERDKYRYLVVFFVLSGAPLTALFGPPASGQGAAEIYSFLRYLGPAATIVNMLIQIGGVLLCYRENQKGDGQEFLSRYISLSLPVKIRLAVYLVLPLILLTVTCTGCNAIQGYDMSISGLLGYTLFLVTALSIIYYLFMWVYIGEVSGADDPSKKSQI